ncbi:hypothetical protein AGMMS49574_12490 [Bacteroidia bacterium]|nr:hypothetical protein AGMMS49574_12490 [Bacteroidia bacterium]
MFKFELASLLGRLFFNSSPKKKSTFLHLGCGGNYLEDFVNADFYYLRWVPFRKQPSKYDWLLDLRYKLNCPNNYWDGVFTEHTLEHLHYSDCLKLFKELYRTMKPGSYLRICVPGLEESLAARKPEQTKAEVIYQLTQNFGHVSVWDEETFFIVLKDAGFSKIQKSSYKQGADERLLRDSSYHVDGSIYIEAQKWGM